MITLNRRIEGSDFSSAGSATRVLKDQLRMAGVPVDTLRRAMIASYEAEMNVVIHARRGTLWARIDGGQLDLEVIDEGPGIPDIELALREGWSTASDEARRMGFGAGMGLPNIRRNSDRFEIDSQVGSGTRVRSTILFPNRPAAAGPRGSGSPGTGARAAGETGAVPAVPALPPARPPPCGFTAPSPGCSLRAASAAPSARPRVPDRVFVIDGADARPPVGTGSVLVVPRGFLASFAAAPAAVLSALSALGFAEVRFTEEWERALRLEALDRTARGGGPLVAPSCPAVESLVEARFPGLLPRMAPFTSPLAAAASGFPLAPAGGRACVPSPARGRPPRESGGQDRDRRAGGPRRGRSAAAGRRSEGRRGGRGVPGGCRGMPAAPRRPPTRRADPEVDGVLRVTGLRHVVRVLELAEAGALPGVRLLEPFACDGGCVGSPYLGADPFVAAHRLALACLPSGTGSPTVPAAVGRRRPRVPRAGSRLDPDMATAIGMLGAIDEAARSLPGRDCGSCGAPSCAAFAEDLVLGRAGASDCPHRTRPSRECSRATA